MAAESPTCYLIRKEVTGIMSLALCLSSYIGLAASSKHLPFEKTAVLLCVQVLPHIQVELSVYQFLHIVLVLLPGTTEQSLVHLPDIPTSDKVLSQSSLLKSNRHSSLSLPSQAMLLSLNHLCWPSLDPLQ